MSKKKKLSIYMMMKDIRAFKAIKSQLIVCL